MSPTEVVRLIAEADLNNDADAIVALTDASAAEAFKQRQISAVEPAPAEDIKRRAGFRAKLLKFALAKNNEYVLSTVYKVNSLEALRSLPALEVIRRRLREAFRAHSAATRDHLAVVTPIGSITAGPETEYVVVERRSRGPTGPIPPHPLVVEVVVVRRTPEGWRSTLNAGLPCCGRTGLFTIGAENAGLPLPA